MRFSTAWARVGGRARATAFSALTAAAACAWVCGGVGAGEAPATPLRDRDKVELGRRLFFDPEVSRSGHVACASCHDPQHGFSDPSPFSLDDFGRMARHSQTILDAIDNPTAHWDGQFTRVEELVTARLGVPSGTTVGTGYGGGRTAPPPLPPGSDDPPPPADEPAQAPPAAAPPAAPVTPSDPVRPEGARDDGASGRSSEGTRAVGPRRRDDDDRKRKPDEPLLHGVPIPDKFDATRLVPAEKRLEQQGRYAEAFEAAYGSPSVTTSRLAEAIAEYVRSVRSTESAYDRYAGGERGALSESARRGLDLFKGRAGCAQCHVTTPKHGRAPFTDYEFHDTGIVFRGVAAASPDAGTLRDELGVKDGGRQRISTRSTDLRAFKTPTLRDVGRRGPYMHDASFRSLDAVVRYYARGGSKDPRQDDRIRPFEASDQDVADLVAFLGSLSGEVRPGLAPCVWRARAERTRLRFVDGEGKPVAGMLVKIVPSGDTLPGDVAFLSRTAELTTDEKGWIEYVPPMRTHARLVLPDRLDPVGGCLVPDTCGKADIVLPVSGRTSLVVTFACGVPAPEEVVLEHTAEMELPEAIRERSVFSRESTVEVGGRPVVRYVGWSRTDVPADGRLLLPGDRESGRHRHVVLAKAGATKIEVEP